MGLGGLIDIATDAGIPRGEEDFGQTFGYWGFPQGPFLFVPVIGPTTVRDGTGLIIRALRRRRSPTSTTCRCATSSTASAFVDLRAQAARGLRRSSTPAALDKYSFIRRSYLQRREYLVHDGNPPKPKDDDE